MCNSHRSIFVVEEKKGFFAATCVQGTNLAVYTPLSLARSTSAASHGAHVQMRQISLLNGFVVLYQLVRQGYKSPLNTFAAL